jgi:hypothetical protein
MTRGFTQTPVFRSLIIAAACWLVSAGNARAQDYRTFNQANYELLADQDAPAIEPGTIITQQNWQKYKAYMPFGLQALWSGQVFWKIPADGQMVVGEAENIPDSKLWREQTEKWAGTTKLIIAQNGGTYLENYQTGRPFPDPSGPNAGEEAMWDFYYKYQPWVSYSFPYGAAYVDKFGNASLQRQWQVYYRLRHVSFTGKPILSPDAGPYDKTQYIEVTEPEQSRYTVALTVFYADPNQLEDHYNYLPALRRALRLSGASRCTPVLGGDTTYEDANSGFNGTPTAFRAAFFYKKKILGVVGIDPLHTKYPDDYFQPIGFPKPEVAKWELRNVWVYDLQRIPALSEGYCYADRVMYTDEQTAQNLYADDYDIARKLWKSHWIGYIPLPNGDPGSPAPQIGSAPTNFFVWDLEVPHASLTGVNLNHVPTQALGNDAPQQFQTDIHRFGSPSGLNEIMR